MSDWLQPADLSLGGLDRHVQATSPMWTFPRQSRGRPIETHPQSLNLKYALPDWLHPRIA
jgi:hypothetical protein